jgi:tetratricopeptide (TPR) repeat protein
VLARLAWSDARFEASLRLSQRGRFLEAIGKARLAVEMDPAWPLYTFQLAYLEGRHPQPENLVAAAAHYRRGLALEPVDGRQTANLAAVLWAAGERADAITALERAVRVDPDPMYLINLGYFQEAEGHVEAAWSSYAHALAQSPSLAGSEYWAAAPSRAGRWPHILARAEAMVGEQSPAGLHGWRLEVALARGDLAAAAEHARLILESNPTDCAALMTLARLALEAGQVGDAAQLAREAVGANRACGAAYLMQGRVLDAQGRLSAAESEWRKALFLGEPLSGYYLGWLAERQGDSIAAETHYRQSIFPHVVRQDVEVALYDRRVTFDLLPPLFRVGVGPAQAEPWFALADLLASQGRVSEARQVYEALLVEDPYLSSAQERLKALRARK